ncbi:hypothetical protein A2U01_0049403 [Trifolium medium]|uniref:Uncharacterized protein n=1 Tax=Trifolium medium TaxID=97028 RepID=A0A392QV12_9FABA|nr:hypothetical protein [Trifolium medium]
MEGETNQDRPDYTVIHIRYLILDNNALTIDTSVAASACVIAVYHLRYSREHRSIVGDRVQENSQYARSISGKGRYRSRSLSAFERRQQARHGDRRSQDSLEESISTESW